MKFDQALKPRIILEYTAIRIIISSISANVCEWGFLIFLSILLSEICLNIHILPFIKSRYSLKFHAQIAAKGDSGSEDFKIFRGSSPGPPPPPMCIGLAPSALVAKQHDHLHQAGFATECRCCRVGFLTHQIRIHAFSFVILAYIYPSTVLQQCAVLNGSHLIKAVF